MRSKTQKNTKWFVYLLWVGAVLVNIKSIFADFGIDNGYAIATSYRHISGDHMFLEMWEPHQTSAFLVDILLLIYRFLVPSLTGVALYLQTMGVLLWVPIIIMLYKELSKHIDKDISHFICVLLFTFRAKQTVFPEFSNMQIGFSLLFFIFIFKYICKQTKLGYLVMSAIFLCLEIISYPTCIIAYVAAIGILFMYTERKGRNILAFSGICFTLGILYIGYFIWARGLTEFIKVLSLLVEADASHAGYSMSLYQYLHVFAEGVIYIAGTIAIAAVIRFCLCKYKDISFLAIWGGVLLCTAGIILFFLIKGKQNGYEWHYCIVLVLLILFGILGYRFLGDIEKKIWVSGTLISFSSFFAVVVLTNCALMSVVAYLSLAAAVSIISLSKFRKGISLAGAILLFVLLHRGLIIWGYSELSYNSFINEAESIIRVGPAAGIICDDTTSCVYRDNVNDFKKFINQDDTLLFIKHSGYDPLCYVQAGADISISSTISSPTFSKYQIEYWKRYSYKTPTVIAIACYGGELMVEPYAYMTIFEWVEEHYDWVGDGIWWRFYRVKE